MDNLSIWNKLRTPPPSALKTIRGGRLNNMTDISPQWRYQAMTEQFGPCGIGWKFVIIKQWIEQGTEGQVFAFANILLYYKHEGEWSEGVHGTGGSMLVVNQQSGPHNNDEAFKMAVTDAVSTAMKIIGVAADIYMGLWDGSKYKEPPTPKPVTSIDTPKRDYKGARSELELLSGSGEAFDKIMTSLKAETWNDFKTDAQKDKLWDLLQKAINKYQTEPPPATVPCPKLDGQDIPVEHCDVCGTRKGCPSHDEGA